MLSSLNKKQRFYLVVFGLIAGFYFAYSFAISNTLQLVDQHNILLIKQTELEEAPYQLARLQQQNQILRAKMSQLETEGITPYDYIVNNLASYADNEGITVLNISTPQGDVEESSGIKTIIAEFSGGFKSLLRLVRFFEIKKFPAQLTSLKWDIQRDRNSRSERLVLTCYFQFLQKPNS